LVDPKLLTIREQNRWRRLEQLPDGLSPHLCFTHNDYLGLQYDPSFQDLAWAAAKNWPSGAGASRLLGGEHSIYASLEKDFATWKGADSSLFFTSGYAANEAIIKALCLPGVDFFSDALNHASLIDGMTLAKLDSKRRKIFRHNDLNHLEQLLKTSDAALKCIVTESLFSMDGDFAPLREIEALADRYQALLVVDEAHSIGLFGPAGQGLIGELGLNHNRILSINPCGKAMGVAGALIAGPSWFRDYLINTARGFIFSTGASPWLAAALKESIAYVSTLDERRGRLFRFAEKVRTELTNIGFNIGASQSQIIPVILGPETYALDAEAWLRARGYRIKAIRPPTVPPESSRLRISLHAAMSEQDIDNFLHTFEQLYAELSPIFCYRNRN
jgi:8-amino-7-oxononanoate synthase